MNEEEPIPVVLWRDGRLVIEWPYGRADRFEMTTELLEEMVRLINELRGQLREALT